MGRSRQRFDINIEELDRLLDRTREGPLSDAEREKLRTALHALVESMSASSRTTEKTRAVVNQPPLGEAGPNTTSASGKQSPKKGHGRHSAGDYTAAEKVAIPHPDLKSGDGCPECARGRVYHQQEPKVRVRIVGQAPLAATVFEMERLRCNACGQVFTADEPDEIGADKYDATAAAMIAQLKYGSGVPFARLERLEHQLGIPLPAATQWELMEDAAALAMPAWKQLIWYAAQGELFYNDDTSMRILRLAREPSDSRTGIFTSGIVSVWQSRKIALFFTGRQHAGENLADVLVQRADLMHAPIQMCDALSRNSPKLARGLRILLANCLCHGRRQFVDIATSFPQECGFVLETLGMVYANDAIAREQGLDAERRLQLHQQYSGPLMDQLHQWLEDQLNEGRTEPNSGLGKAISYLLRHWQALTLFLREKGAPLDNNLCERALKKAILNRKNALFYKTLNGAQVGDLFMSLIHTCELNGVNPFDYLTELQRHCLDVERTPADWMPWNYHDTLARMTSPIAA
jgi:transposase